MVCGGSKTSNMINIAPQDAVPAYNRLRAAQRPCLHARAATGQNSNKFQKTIQCMHAGKEKKKGIPARTRTLATVNVAYIQQAYLISARAVKDKTMYVDQLFCVAAPSK